MTTAAPHLKIRFWWNNYQPEQIFEDPTALFALEKIPAEQLGMVVLTSQDSAWRKPEPGSRLGTIVGYVEEQELLLDDVILVTSQRRGGWKGLYEFTFTKGGQ